MRTELLNSIRTIGMTDVAEYQSDIEIDLQSIKETETLPNKIVYMTRKQGTWLFGLSEGDEIGRLKMITDFYARNNTKIKLYVIDTKSGVAKKTKVDKAVAELSKALDELQREKARRGVA